MLSKQALIPGCRNENMKDMRCMSFTSKTQNEILVAGFQDKMFVIDVNKGEITKEVWTCCRLGSGLPG